MECIFQLMYFREKLKKTCLSPFSRLFLVLFLSFLEAGRKGNEFSKYLGVEIRFMSDCMWRMGGAKKERVQRCFWVSMSWVKNPTTKQDQKPRFEGRWSGIWWILGNWEPHAGGLAATLYTGGLGEWPGLLGGIWVTSTHGCYNQRERGEG